MAIQPQPSTGLAVVANNTVLAAPGMLTKEQIELVKATVAKGATDDELKMFLHIATKHNLDPFMKEIWFIKRAKKVQKNGEWDYKRNHDGSIDYSGAETVIMTSRDGYLKHAMDHPDYRGLTSFVVREGDTFEIDADSHKVTHKFSAKRGKIIGAWAKCEREGRTPVIVFADFDEYDLKQSVWKQYPSAMIQKVAEAMALKKQFNINGLVAQEEMPLAYSGHLDPVLPAPTTTMHAEPEPDTRSATPDPQGYRWATGDNRPASEAQRKRVFALGKNAGYSAEDVKAKVKELTGKSIDECTRDDVQKVFAVLEKPSTPPPAGYDQYGDVAPPDDLPF